MPDDQAKRLYALSLLNRADAAYEARDIALLAQIIPLIEADVAGWLGIELSGVVSRTQTVRAVKAGQYRYGALSKLAQPGEAA